VAFCTTGGPSMLHITMKDAVRLPLSVASFVGGLSRVSSLLALERRLVTCESDHKLVMSDSFSLLLVPTIGSVP
jgi:hypothetical protein